jgi:hypothetical protein
MMKELKGLPCIKKCMTNFDIENGFENCRGDCYDFKEQGAVSSIDCRQFCDAGKICPELLPATCDRYLQGECDCEVICKSKFAFLKKTEHKESFISMPTIGRIVFNEKISSLDF